ncbi:uncharacterized protein PgNI_09776 [Pyricularia grisea]|uniref:Uncharacterized protein n=1 Tax=Pyricularia grisea TaxID=148305 RepID=A0A6P8ARG6_PYRGI|nr:uncharacterized protein PgNI_09776 [Pyricularia grisea]TLD04726.1 hypothetical protein PgNI_09776 [Pyricularia grisea]
MPPIERDAPSQVYGSLRHQHSGSLPDNSRALVPMWDSSDPERAPPPLPLNPNPHSPGLGSPSKPGTSAAIQSAHAALTEKARENALNSGPAPKRKSEVSPERSSLIKTTPAHRRMQSLQPSTVREFGLLLENGTGGRDSISSTPQSMEKFPRPGTPKDPFSDFRSPEDANRQNALALSPGPSLTPIVRPIARRSTQSILGENTPPQSATMLALQNMSTPTREKTARELPIPQPAPAATARELPETPLSNVTNNSNALVRQQQSQPSVAIDSLSQQILSLTNIATSLQKEMAQLSRRSRDNATDLLSLKEATNTRDEDIRKSLRDLVSNTQEISKSTLRDAYGGNLLLDNKPHSAPSISSKSVRPFSLPRIPSPNSFSASLDGDRMSTPSLCGSDGPATMGLLEKIVRDMGTKDGQNLLVGRLSELAEKMSGMATAAKVEELLRLVKTSQDQSIVFSGGSSKGNNNGNWNPPPGRPRNFSFDEDPSPAARELEFGRSGLPPPGARALPDPGFRASSAPPVGEVEIITEDVIRSIRAVKDSVAQGGGLTAEVKALVRELRGEVLGMGREIGRRLEEVQNKKPNRDESVTRIDMAKIIDDGLEEMKQHMNQLMREHRRQSTAASRGPVVDYSEIYNSMRSALKDSQALNKPRKDEMTKEDVMQAIQEAWETYKPDIQVQQIGLERDEVLDCLQEGLREYAPQNEVTPGATREEVFQAVVEGLKHFTPPQVEPPSSLSRDEILGAVRECLEEFEFPVAPSAIGAELSKKDMVDAVREGLEGIELPQRDNSLVQRGIDNEEIQDRIREIMQVMREEFHAVSEEAKQNVAANGRDTEQVLDATKDGFEKLRIDMESYVDRVSGAAGQEEFLEGLVRTLDLFREEISDLVSKSSNSSREVLQTEIENLRETVNSSLVPMSVISTNNGGSNNKEVLEALQDGIGSLRNEMANRPIAGTNEVLDALQEGLEDLKSSIEKMANKPADLTANDEILDALRSGLDGVKSEIGTMRDTSNDKAVAMIPDNSAAIVPLDVLRQDDIKNLEGLITQLRTKVDGIETSATPVTPVASISKEDVASKEDLSGIISMLEKLQESVTNMPASSREPAATDAATREDVVAIETILRNAKSRLDDLMDGEQAVRKDHIDALETIVLESKESLAGLAAKLDGSLEGLSRQQDLKEIESLIAQVANEFEEMRDRHDKQLADPERVTKTDVGALEAVCLDVKSAVDQMVKADLAALPNKEDLQKLENLLNDLKEKVSADAEATVKAFDDRQAETVGVNENVKELKAFLEEFQTSVKEKLEEGKSGMDSLTKLLEGIGETAGKSAGVSDDLKVMFEAVKIEFEESRAGVVGAKLETDENFKQTTDTLSAKMDEKVGELLLKYETFQTEMEERAKNGEARDLGLEEAVIGTKAVAEELKTLIDTLGATVTDSLEKMEEASKTVFSRVEDLVNKTDENQADAKVEHQLTRDEIKQAYGAVEGFLTDKVCEYQPQILESIKTVLHVVSEHFEHSKSSTETIQEKIVESKPELPMLPPIEKYDDTQVIERLDKLSERYDAATLMEKLATLSEKCDDTQVIERLDKLSERYDGDGAALMAKLDTLNEKCDDTQVIERLDKLSERYDGDGAALMAKLDTLNEKCDDTQVIERLDKLSERYDGAALMVKLESLDEKYDGTLVVHEKIDSLTLKYEEGALNNGEKIDKLSEKVSDDNTAVREKLDKLVDHTETADKAFNKLDTLEKVHQQVLKTAAEVSAFVAAQTLRISDEHEDREKTLQETTLAIERGTAQKEALDEDITRLRKEQEELRLSVQQLREEQEELARQRTRLTADVASLETAVTLRREELREVEDRAQGLERRILEGVMDHSRVMLMAKAGGFTKGRDAMSRKRVSSNRQKNGNQDASGAVDGRPAGAERKQDSKKMRTVPINMAISTATANRNGLAPPNPGPQARRIVSLSQINHNVPAGGFKRSQSVRQPGRPGMRKSSWAGGRDSTPVPAIPKAYGDMNSDDKENSVPRRVSEDGREDDATVQPTPHEAAMAMVLADQITPPATELDLDLGQDDDVASQHSEADTLRRTSMGTSVITAESSVAGTYDGSGSDRDSEDYDSELDDASSQWTESQVGVTPSDVSGTGSEVVLYET